MTKKWDADSLPDLSGQVVVITGSNSGIGYEAARAIIESGGEVVFACRTPSKAEEAIELILRLYPHAKTHFIPLDLSSLNSVKSFSEAFKEKFSRLDRLINNAGIMAVPYGKTEDGFEMQIGTNHFGHFALTGLLMDLLKQTPDARVVTVSSGAHNFGDISFDDVSSSNSYNRWRAYGESKLANLLFTYELDRKLRSRNFDILSTAAHPGFASTNLGESISQIGGKRLGRAALAATNAVLAQSAEMGALPTLRAAYDEESLGGEFYGPTKFGGFMGYPEKVKSNRKSRDKELAKKFWEFSEQQTGVVYEDFR